MEEWLILALAGALCWGIYNFAVKIAVGRDFLNSSVKTTVFFIVLGIALAYAVYFFLSKGSFSLAASNSSAALLGIFLGLIWGAGTIIFLGALSKGADVSKMTPIFNLSILIPVILGIVILHELPDKAQAIKVFIGALLTIIGATLIAL